MPSMRELKDWMVTSQVAEHLGISRQRVVTLANEGRLRAVKVGGVQWIYDPESVEVLAGERHERQEPMIAGVLRDMDADRAAFMPDYKAGRVSRAEVDAYIVRQEARLKLTHGAAKTADAMEFVESVRADLDRL